MAARHQALIRLKGWRRGGTPWRPRQIVGNARRRGG